ncbi:hypothetical protein T265_09981, partial [Opisthorchis viverrini]
CFPLKLFRQSKGRWVYNGMLKRMNFASPLYTSGWPQVSYLTQVFGKRLVKEYIPLLQERN